MPNPVAGMTPAQKQKRINCIGLLDRALVTDRYLLAFCHFAPEDGEIKLACSSLGYPYDAVPVTLQGIQTYINKMRAEHEGNGAGNICIVPNPAEVPKNLRG